MRPIILTELKKIKHSKMWWLVIIGTVIPVIIAYLSHFERVDVTWQIYIHSAMLNFNVASLLIFSTFAAFLWAREYEDNTIEISMCYPYPKHRFLTVKLMLMLLVIGLAFALFVITTIILGIMIFSMLPNYDDLRLFINTVFSITVMQFMIVPGAFFLATLTRNTISGAIWGIVCMFMCMTLYRTGFIQYLPPCIPIVLSSNLLGMNVIHVNPNYTIHWIILWGYFIGFLISSYFVIGNKLLD